MEKILSVGIDIGTSTTQLIFSRISLENTAGYFTAPRISITEKETVYKSKVWETPLLDFETLDAKGIREIAASEFRSAGYTSEDVNTGAVIITGESARKENAASVLEALSAFAGEFVVSTAGPDLESIIAGKGSGAYKCSMDSGLCVVNLDIGGGTTNIVCFDAGDTAGKCCFDIGGRLIRVDKDLKVLYVSRSAAEIAKAAGVKIAEGSTTTREELSRITDKMAVLLAEALGLAPQEAVLSRIATPHSSAMTLKKPVKRIFFSGGVGESVYHGAADDFAYGDIGPLLGKSIRKCGYFDPPLLAEAKETVRATVIGAGTYTTTISGSTITYSDGLFPVKNIPALRLSPSEEDAVFAGDEKALAEKLLWFLQQSDSKELLLAMTGPHDPSYQQIKTAAACIVHSADRVLAPGTPVIVISENDTAKALGASMKRILPNTRKLASIDGIRIESGDFVDIGRPLMDGLVVPVVVKTLLFG